VASVNSSSAFAETGISPSVASPLTAAYIGLYEGTKHSFATDAIRRGVPERHLQRFLRHASVTSTRRYARLADSAMLEALRNPAKPA